MNTRSARLWFAAFLCSVVHSTATYLPIVAGQTLIPTLANDEPVFFTGSSWERITAFDFTVASAGFRDADGNIDFFYQITRSTTSTLVGDLSFSLKYFGSDWNHPMEEVEVGYRTDDASLPFPFGAGSIAPLSVNRSADGDVITFDFGSLLTPGATTAMFIISTHQRNLASGPITTNVGGVPQIQTVAVTMPNFRVPDSGSCATLLSVALIVSGVVSRRRQQGVSK